MTVQSVFYIAVPVKEKVFLEIIGCTRGAFVYFPIFRSTCTMDMHEGMDDFLGRVGFVVFLIWHMGMGENMYCTLESEYIARHSTYTLHLTLGKMCHAIRGDGYIEVHSLNRI